jgi:hypothetical protein
MVVSLATGKTKGDQQEGKCGHCGVDYDSNFFMAFLALKNAFIVFKVLLP